MPFPVAVAMVCLWGVSLTHHINEVKPYYLISAIAAAMTSALITPAPARSAGCWPALAVTDYGKFVNGGASPDRALRLAINDNYDGTEICRLKINSAFRNSGLPMPFGYGEATRRTRTTSASNYSSCNERVDDVFYKRYPELRGKKLSNMNNSLAREWIAIQNSIC